MAAEDARLARGRSRRGPLRGAAPGGKYGPGRERTRAPSGSPPAFGDFTQDVRYALRGLRRRPGYAAAAIVTLMLGIGATTALFSVLDAVLLKSLPYTDPGRLVQVWEHNIPRDRPGEPGGARPTSSTGMTGPGASSPWRCTPGPAPALTGDAPEILDGRAVSTNFFATLGARPALGRLFAPEDTLPGAPVAMVLSHDLWIRRFGGDPAVIGRTVLLRDGPGPGRGRDAAELPARSEARNTGNRGACRAICGFVGAATPW